jgi:hypothetical protein
MDRLLTDSAAQGDISCGFPPKGQVGWLDEAGAKSHPICNIIAAQLETHAGGPSIKLVGDKLEVACFETTFQPVSRSLSAAAFKAIYFNKGCGPHKSTKWTQPHRDNLDLYGVGTFRSGHTDRATASAQPSQASNSALRSPSFHSPQSSHRLSLFA